MNSERLPTGYQLQNYRIDEILGEGGFGITYKATDLNLNRVVAIKEYIPLGSASRSNTGDVVPSNPDFEEAYQQGLQRFVEEAQALALFEHDNLVKVKSFLRQHNTAYIIMEYVDGMTFSEWLRQNPKPSEDKLLALVTPILNGLHELHKAKLLHRDIKPSNIYICANDRPILLDFGAVRNSMRSDQNKELSVIQYTEGYAPPEQYGKSGQGPWTDVYAVGACLHLAVTGEKVTNAMERFAAVQNGEPDPQPQIQDIALRDDYSAHFLDAIEQAISLNRKERIDGALTLKNRLLNIDPLSTANDETTVSNGRSRLQPDDATIVRAIPEGDATVVRNEEDAPTTFRPAETADKTRDAITVNQSVDEKQPKESAPSSIVGKSGSSSFKLIIGVGVIAAIALLSLLLKPSSEQDQTLDTEIADTKASINNNQVTADPVVQTTSVETPDVEPRIVEIGSSDKDIDEALALCKEFTSDCTREWYADEVLTQVTLSPFELDKSEVTVGDFSEFAKSRIEKTAAEDNGFSFIVDPTKAFAILRSDGINWKNAYGNEIDASKFPVVHINRAEAAEYCKSVGKRLPTEAEWEYIARGDERFKFPWGNAWDGSRVNWGGNNPISMSPINSFKDNGRGYYDLAGSVTEWTSTDSNEENTAILKGGSLFDKNVANFRLAVKRLESVDYTGEDVGFRCARTASQWPVN